MPATQDAQDNPLVYAEFVFADGTRMGIRIDPHVPQAKFMADLGWLTAKWGQPKIDLVLPKPAIFLDGNLSEGFTARGPYIDIDAAAWDNDRNPGWLMTLEPPMSDFGGYADDRPKPDSGREIGKPIPYELYDDQNATGKKGEAK